MQKLLSLYMLAFLKRHIITLSLLLLCGFVGIVVYMNETPVDMWLIEYEFQADSDLPSNLRSDTVFQHEGILCRNYTGSIGDTLSEEGIRRYELKMYIPKLKFSQELMMNSSEEVLPSPALNIVKRRFLESQRNRKKILYWVLVGFFLGIVAEFIFSLKKKPRTN